MLGWAAAGPLGAQPLGTLDTDDQTPQQIDPAMLPIPADEAAEPLPDLTADEAQEALQDPEETGDADPADATGEAYRLDVRAPDNLRTLLRRHLDLARFRRQTDITDLEINRLVAVAPAQARSLLETEGYFNARIAVRREPGPDGQPPEVIVTVEPGEQARIGGVNLDVQGAFRDALSAEDRRTEIRWRILRARWSLREGQAFSQSAWNSAKNALLADLRSEGYPLANFAGTSAQVDAANQTVQLLAIIDSGPLFRLGEVRIDGVERTTEAAVRNVAPFSKGEVFTEKHLLDYQERLQQLGLYQGVAVELDADPANAQAAEVIVRVREHRHQTATVSVGFSTNTGARVGLAHTHRRPLGKEWIAQSRVLLGRDERLLALDLISYPKPRGYRNLFAASADYLDAAGALTQSQRLRYGRSRETERIDRLYYLEYNRTNLETPGTETTASAVSANYEWLYRDVNNVVFPTRGWVLNANVGVGMSRDSDGNTGPFTRAYTRTTWYQPLGSRADGWLLQARAEAGYVFKRQSLGMPEALLFRTGGDDTVRGYGYQTLGPQRDGATVGGPVLLTGSVEVMRRLSPRLRDWYGAVFVDAGNSAERFQDWRAQRGYGVGIRWHSPVGALRGDLAYGQGVGRLRLHLSVGVAF